MRWFAVHTNSRAEGLAESQLKRLGHETLFLHYWDTVSHARRKMAVKRSLFPRYIFVGVANIDELSQVNRTVGVSTVIYCGEEPLEIPWNVIEELKSRGDSAGRVYLAKKEREKLRVGQKVRINHGPLMGFLAQVAVDNGAQISVWVEMFKGRVKTSLSPGAVSPEMRSTA